MNRRIFNLEDAKEMNVVTRDGRPVEILTVDKRLLQPIIAVLDSGEGLEAETFCANGMYCTHGTETEHDLFLTPKPKTIWVNFYDGMCATIHPSRERADEAGEAIGGGIKRIACVKVEYTVGEGLQP